MSTDGGHLGWSFGSLDIFLKGFNIGPYGKKCFKIFSSETSKPI
jgi:hypothetical protein